MTYNTRELKLTRKQLQILHIVFKFRFVTSILLAQYLTTDKGSLYKRLKILLNMGLLVKDYDPHWRIDRNPAEYSLSPVALKLLREEGLDAKTLHSMYNNKRILRSARQQCLDIMQLTCALKQQYGDEFYYYTANDLARQDEFPIPRPSLYLTRVEPSSELSNGYFIELYHTAQPFIVRARFKALLQHFDDEGWPDGEYPILLFILETERQEKNFSKFAQATLDSAGIDELTVHATTFEKFLSSSSLESIKTTA